MFGSNYLKTTDLGKFCFRISEFSKNLFANLYQVAPKSTNLNRNCVQIQRFWLNLFPNSQILTKFTSKLTNLCNIFSKLINVVNICSKITDLQKKFLPNSKILMNRVSKFTNLDKIWFQNIKFSSKFTDFDQIPSKLINLDDMFKIHTFEWNLVKNWIIFIRFPFKFYCIDLNLISNSRNCTKFDSILKNIQKNFYKPTDSEQICF